MSNDYASTSPDQHQERYPQIDLPPAAQDLDMSNPEHRCAVYAQADLLHFSGVVPAELDKLIDKGDVVALFTSTFGYAASTFEETDHYQLVKQPWYRGEFAWRRRAEETWHAANTRWYKSRVIALILALKRAPSSKDCGERGEPDYPHPAGDENVGREEVREQGLGRGVKENVLQG